MYLGPYDAKHALYQALKPDFLDKVPALLLTGYQLCDSGKFINLSVKQER